MRIEPTYLTNTFPTTPLVDFDDSQTNSFKAASFDLISVTGEITGAVLKLRAIPLDDNRGEGNDKIIVSGFDASGNSIMPSYNIGLGVDAGPNNYFDFDWQIDGRPAHPSEGYEILIDLSDFSAQEGTGLSLLENIKAQKLLDVVLPPDTMVDYVRLEVTTADSSSQVTEGSIKNLDITVTGPKEIPLSSNSKFGTSQFSAESNGDGFLISWSSVQPGGGAGGIYLQKTDDTGLPIGNRITIDDGGNVQHPQSIALDNGNTAFTYNKYVSGRYQTKILILDADLNVLSNTISHSGEASGDYINARLDDLGNSKFALKWDYTPNHPQQPTEGSKIQIFNYDGSKEGSSFPISQTGQTYAAQEISSFDVDYLGTLITSNVGGDRELSFDVYDLDTKSKLNSVLISDGADNDYFGPYHVTKTPNGFSVSWTEGSSKTGYVQFFDKLGVATGDALTIGDNINRLSEVTTRTLENGSAISEVFWGTTNDDGDKITNYSLIENYNPSSLITKNEVINGYNSVMIPGVSSGGSFVLFSNESFADPIRTFTVDTAFHNAVDLTGMSSARSSISIIDQALNRINSSRSNLGAISNRLDHVVANNTNIATNLTASMGRIQDADYAAESTQLVKNQLIQQSSVAMIAQANASKEDVLQLIEGD
jgi:flagellin-like hook-associated protein FlgL